MMQAVKQKEIGMKTAYRIKNNQLTIYVNQYNDLCKEATNTHGISGMYIDARYLSGDLLTAFSKTCGMFGELKPSRLIRVRKVSHCPKLSIAQDSEFFDNTDQLCRITIARIYTLSATR
jgi:hypothetical protein